jgi:hypothetical protein
MNVIVIPGYYQSDNEQVLPAQRRRPSVSFVLSRPETNVKDQCANLKLALCFAASVAFNLIISLGN